MFKRRGRSLNNLLSAHEKRQLVCATVIGLVSEPFTEDHEESICSWAARVVIDEMLVDHLLRGDLRHVGWNGAHPQPSFVSDDLPNSSRGVGLPETPVASRLTPQQERQLLRGTPGGGQRLLVWAGNVLRTYSQLKEIFDDASHFSLATRFEFARQIRPNQR